MIAVDAVRGWRLRWIYGRERADDTAVSGGLTVAVFGGQVGEGGIGEGPVDHLVRWRLVRGGSIGGHAGDDALREGTSGADEADQSSE